MPAGEDDHAAAPAVVSTSRLLPVARPNCHRQTWRATSCASSTIWPSPAVYGGPPQPVPRRSPCSRYQFGHRHHAVAGRLQADVLLGAGICPARTGARVHDGQAAQRTVPHGIGVGGREVAPVASFAFTCRRGVSQTLVHDQPRRHGDGAEARGSSMPSSARRCLLSICRTSNACSIAGLTGAGGHLRAVLGMRVAGARGPPRVDHQPAVLRRRPVHSARSGAAQHFMRHDGVEDRLLLAGMEIERAGQRVFAEPPAQQFCGGRRDQFAADQAVPEASPVQS